MVFKGNHQLVAVALNHGYMNEVIKINDTSTSGNKTPTTLRYTSDLKPKTADFSIIKIRHLSKLLPE